MTTTTPETNQNEAARTPAGSDDLLWRHLKSVPAFRALLRAVEARFYRQLQQRGEIRRPVLDIGCGDGHFATMAFDEPLEAGIDPWQGPLQKARRAAGHRLVIQGVGDRLPFPNAHFATVISNSVLEHIPDVQPVLHDANRVLQPGGRLIFTAPSQYFTQFLGGADFLAGLGLPGLADRYRRFFNYISRHAHTDPPELWAERLATAGFEVTQWQYYFSQDALKALEWGHVQGLPSAILHFLTEQWIIAPWQENLRPTEQWVRPYYEEPYPNAGAYLLFVARKSQEKAIPIHLPRPRCLEETPALETSQPAPPPLEEAPAAVDETAGDPHLPLPEATKPQTAAPAAAPPDQPNARVTIGLIAASLFAALIGQAALSAGPAEPWGGLRWYGLSLLGLLLAAWYAGGWRLPALSRPTIGPIPRRRWLLGGAFLLSLLAYGQAGGGMAAQRPWLALLLWAGAAGAAVYALWNEEAGQKLRALSGYFSRREAVIVGTIFLAALILRLANLTGHPFIMSGTEANMALDGLRVAEGQLRHPFSTGWLTNPTLPAFLQAIPIRLFGPTLLAARLLSPLWGALTVAGVYLVGRRFWGREVGLVAAVLLAVSPWHIHYSRLGTTNVWDPLLALAALALLAWAWRRPDRLRWLAAGLVIGLNAYLFTSSRLLPLVLLFLFLWLLLTERQRLWRQRFGLLTALAAALVVALPQALFYLENPHIYLDRVNTVGVFQSGWLAAEAARSGLTTWQILAEQFWATALAFNYTLDKTTLYAPGRPLLHFLAAIFFLLGLALAVARLRQIRYAILVWWLLATLIFGGALLLEPPNSYRLLFAAPAVTLLAAIMLVKLTTYLLREWGGAAAVKRYLLPALLVVMAVIALGDLAFYFGAYRAEARFGDRNTEVAHEMSHYLAELGVDWTVYFYGAPVMYADFPTITYLARLHHQHGYNLFNAPPPGSDPTDLPQPPDLSPHLVFIFLPERSVDVETIMAEYPGGRLHTHLGVHANPLFYTYELPAS